MHRYLIALTFVGCTVQTLPPPAGPPPGPPPPAAEPAPAPAPEPAPAPAPPPVAVAPAPPAQPLLNLLSGTTVIRINATTLTPDGKRNRRIVDVTDDRAVGAIMEAIAPAMSVPPSNCAQAFSFKFDSSRRGELARVELCDNGVDGRLVTNGTGLRLADIAPLQHALGAVGVTFPVAPPRTGGIIATPPPPPPPADAHPAYRTAITNLRQARALLERPRGDADVKWDEQAAIRDIDVALAEIHRARVDDGRPVTEHAPIESQLVYRDRLKEAEKQLHEAARDLEEREDNAWAKRERRAALDAIRRAEKATHEAMEDRKADKAERKEEKREEKAERKGH